jgi:hypothetical protein
MGEWPSERDMGVIEMISGIIGTLSRVLDRFGLHTLAKSRPPTAAFCKPRRQRARFAIISFVLVRCLTQSYAAEILECPEIGAGVPDLIGDTTGSGLVTTENRVELVNEINYLINKLQINDPNISSTDIQNVLIAAYCRVVARAPGLTASEKWSRMRQFDGVVEQQVASNTLAPGTVIIASVPLPADVYEELRSQAALSHQTAAQLMAAILARAAGR